MFKKLAISGFGIVVALTLVSCGDGTGSGGTTTVANVTTSTAAVSTTTALPTSTTPFGDTLRTDYPSSESFSNDSLNVLAGDPDGHKGAAVTLTGQLIEDAWADDTEAVPLVSFYLVFPDDPALVFCSTEMGSSLLKADTWVEVRGLVAGLATDEAGDDHIFIYVDSVAQAVEITTTITTAETTTTEVLSQKWGATAEVNGQRITVSVPATDKGSWVEVDGKVDKTRKVIVAEVVIENIGSAPHVYDPSDFILIDTSDFNWIGEAGYAGASKPGLNSGDVQPGKRVHGYVYYDVPVDAAASRIEYAPVAPTGGSFILSAIWEYK